MKHLFIGGPMNGKVVLLDALVGGEELARNIPWEEYDRIAYGKTPTVDEFGDAGKPQLELVQWRYREIPSESIPTPVTYVTSPIMERIPDTQPVDGGWPLVPVMIQPGYENSERIPVRMEATTDIESVAPIIDPPAPSASPSETSDDLGIDANIDTRDDSDVAPDVDAQPWQTFEERRKSVKKSRDLLGTELGGSKSLGWRLESGNVSNSDARKLGVNSIDDVYAAADRLLRSWGA
jgi:hypothetical protein